MRVLCLAVLLESFLRSSSAVWAHQQGIRASPGSASTPGGAGAPRVDGQDPTEEIGREEEQIPHLARLAAFAGWAESHGKEYGTESERGRRLRVWLENDDRIREHNEQRPPPAFLLGHNAFSDLTGPEFASLHGMDKPYRGRPADPRDELEEEDPAVAEQRRALLDETLELPDYVNWAELGAVTPVKNQGSCGACWAFSTTGALEGAKFVKTGELVALSEQNLLDCDHVDLGCGGGLMDNAFKFDEKTGGLCSEADYPYKAKQGKMCITNCTDVPGTIVDTFIDVPAGKQKALLRALAMQPISVAIQGSQFVFQFYKSGVLTDSSCGKSGSIDHGVLAVGYGTDLDTQEPYFLVKNSWGPAWGDAGFVKIGRKTKNQYGICSILKLASFPVVK